MDQHLRSFIVILCLLGTGPVTTQAQQFVNDEKAQPTLRAGTSYFCPPCSCDRDGEAFHEHGRCPACNMKLLEAGQFNNELAALSPDGSTLAFLSTRDGNVEIYAVDTDGANVRRLTHHVNEDKHVSWSPDGAQILYTSYDKTTRTSAIYLMNADGSEPRNLTQHPSWNGLPVLSPDGHRVAFQTKRDDNWDVFVVNTDGSGLLRITHDEAFDGSPRWSDDGAQIHFTSRRDGDPALYAIASDGTGTAQRIEFPEADGLSPDGTRIVYEETQEATATTDLFVSTLENSDVVRLTATTGYKNIHPLWSSDGERIFFTSDRDGQREVYTIKADGSNQTRLTFGAEDH